MQASSSPSKRTRSSHLDEARPGCVSRSPFLICRAAANGEEGCSAGLRRSWQPTWSATAVWSAATRPARFAALRAHREDLIEPQVARHEGRIVKLMGDGLLAEFPSAVNAVMCAIEIQRAMAERNAGVPESRRIQLPDRHQHRRHRRRGPGHPRRRRQRRRAIAGAGAGIWHLHRGERARRACRQARPRLRGSGRAAPQEHREADPRLSDPARPDGRRTLRRAAMRSCRTGPRSSSCPSPI